MLGTQHPLNNTHDHDFTFTYTRNTNLLIFVHQRALPRICETKLNIKQTVAPKIRAVFAENKRVAEFSASLRSMWLKICIALRG